ncbi:MAG: hypothetical protein IPG02_09175 [Ignavibacteria bacterium]|nr:hypothetical protein [Ignavibacteria bacterium]
MTFPRITKGLLASWDYATTSLLNSQGGSGGGATSKYDHELRDEGVSVTLMTLMMFTTAESFQLMTEKLSTEISPKHFQVR